MNNFNDLVNSFIELITLVIPLLFGLTFLVIAWGVINAWIINGGDQGKVDEGKRVIAAGILALVVMSGVWGILALLQSSLF